MLAESTMVDQEIEKQLGKITRLRTETQDVLNSSKVILDQYRSSQNMFSDRMQKRQY